MSISLEKRAEHVGIILEKRNLTDIPPMRVGFALDVSGSTIPLFDDGTMQDTTERLLAIALRFDNNGSMDMWSFDNNVHELPEANSRNYERYCQREIVDNDKTSKWGGTYYAPAIQAVIDRYFEGETKKTGGFLGFGGKTTHVLPDDINVPAICFFVTDGKTEGESYSRSLLKLSSQYPIYWVMVGVGDPDDFKFLNKVADDLDNVGFLHLEDMSISDDDLYSQLLTEELIGWIKQQNKG